MGEPTKYLHSVRYGAKRNKKNAEDEDDALQPCKRLGFVTHHTIQPVANKSTHSLFYCIWKI